MFNKIKSFFKNAVSKVRNSFSAVQTDMTAKAHSVLDGTKAEAYVDTGVKILIAVVIGALLLGLLYQGYECVGKLQDECEKLKSYGFSRCHQGFLINLSKVRKIDKKSVSLNNGITIPISRQYRQSLMQDFNLYLAGISL